MKKPPFYLENTGKWLVGITRPHRFHSAIEGHRSRSSAFWEAALVLVVAGLLAAWYFLGS
jgi:hypothetical protein